MHAVGHRFCCGVGSILCDAAAHTLRNWVTSMLLRMVTSVSVDSVERRGWRQTPM